MYCLTYFSASGNGSLQYAKIASQQAVKGGPAQLDL